MAEFSSKEPKEPNVPAAASASKASKPAKAAAASKPTKAAGTPTPLWIRIILSISKALLIPFLCFWAIYAGLVVGYVVLGKQSMADVTHWETWRYVYKLVFQDV